MRRETRDELLRGFLAINAMLREEAKALKQVLEKRSAEAKYNPNWRLQPRAPRGTMDGGQWVGGSGSGSSGAQSGEPKTERQRIPLRRTISLADEEGGQHRGHTIREHVGRSRTSLIRRVRRERTRILFITVGRRRDGSLSSLSSANRLVNATLAQNRAIVDEVASGRRRRAFVRGWFRSPTVSKRTRQAIGRRPIFERLTVSAWPSFTTLRRQTGFAS